MAEEYPRGAYLLLLIGGIIEIVVGITVIFAAAVYMMVVAESGMTIFTVGQMPGEWMLEFGAVCWIIYILWFTIWGALIILSAKWVKTGNLDEVHKGAILGLIASILGFNIISLIGAILAFTWKESSPVVAAPPPPPPPV